MKPDFLIIPYQLFESKELTPLDRNIYGVIYWFEHLKDGKCFASNKTIGGILNAEAESVSNSISRLHKLGFVSVIIDKKTNQRKRLETNIAYSKIKIDPPLDNEPPPLDNEHNNKNKDNKEEEYIVPKIQFDYETKQWIGITDKDKQDFQSINPDCKVEIELEAMKQWLLDDQRHAKKHYRRFISGWLKRAKQKTEFNGWNKNKEVVKEQVYKCITCGKKFKAESISYFCENCKPKKSND